MEPITAISYNMLQAKCQENDFSIIARIKGVRETHVTHARSDRDHYVHAAHISGQVK
jgi:hypothetical protein